MKINSISFSYYVLYFLLIIVGTVIVLSFSQPINQSDYLEIIVSEGDTLWEISKEFNNKHDFTSVQFVEFVKKINNIDDKNIYPGDKLVIPILKSNDHYELNTFATKDF